MTSLEASSSEAISSEASSSKASSSEAVYHQKFKFIRICKLEDSKAVKWIECRIYIAKEWKKSING